MIFSKGQVFRGENEDKGSHYILSNGEHIALFIVGIILVY